MLGEWMEREIREQPDRLFAGAARYYGEFSEVLSGASFDMVVLVARGSSDNAALYARYLIESKLGIPVSLAAPSVLTRYGRKLRYPKCLGIAISQSGAGPDISEVLESLREDGHATIAVTNTPLSRVTQAAEHSMLLGVGQEQSVAATKTYSASLLAVYELVRALGGDLPAPKERLPDDRWVDAARVAASLAQGPVIRSSPLFSLARGYDYCTAQETALKLMECALISCKAFSSADFEHGPKALAEHGSCAICFDGDKPGLAAQGCEIVLSPSLPSRLDETLSPIWNILFGQWLALSAARARGLDPDDPRHIQKVTQTL